MCVVVTTGQKDRWNEYKDEGCKGDLVLLGGKHTHTHTHTKARAAGL